MSRPRRILKLLGLAAGGLLALVAVAVAAAVFVLQGERLAEVIARVLPPMAGKIEVKAVHWRVRALLDLLTDAPTPLVVEGLRITDPEGTVVLHVPHLAVKVRARSAIRGKIRLSGMRVGPGSLWRFAQLRKVEENGFLSSFAPRGARPAPPEPLEHPREEAEGDPFYFAIEDAQLEGLTAVFDFPAWGLELRNCRSPVSLLVDGKFVGWDAQGLDARDGGYLRILEESTGAVLPFDRVLVNRVATTRDWPDRIFLDVAAARTGRSTLTAKGFFTEIYGYGEYAKTRDPEAGIQMHAAFADAADALAALPAVRKIPGLTLGGAGARLSIDLAEPFARLKIAAALQGLDVGFGDYRALGLALRARVVTDPLALSLEELSFGAPGGGKLLLSADLAGPAVKARLRLDRFTTDSYVPAGLRRVGAGKLSGQLAVAGDLDAKRVSVGPIAFQLVRARPAGLPRTVEVRGQASAARDRLSTGGLVIRVPGATAEVRAEVQLAKQLFSLALKASTSDLPGLLTALGIEPMARGAALSIEAGGSFLRPHARGEVVVHGVGVAPLPELPQVRTRFRLQDGTLHVDELGGPAFGGRLEGRSALRLYQGTITRMLRSPVLSFRLDGRDLELSTLLALGVASGKLSFQATAAGPLDRLRARVEIPAGATVNVLGAPWEIGGIDVEVDASTLVVRTARVGRAGGARIEVEGRMALQAPMEMFWRVRIRDMAIETLPGMASAGVPITGRLSADLTAAGALPYPRLTGTVDLAGVTARGVRLGDGSLAIAPAGDAALALRGSLFSRFELQGHASFGPGGPRVTGSVSFAKLRLEELLPELAALGDGKGLLTGQVSVEWRPDAPPLVEARVQELQVSIAREVLGPDGRPHRQPLWVRNAGELRALVRGDRVVLDQARLVTDGGDFKVQGELVGEALRGAVAGHLDLDLLQPFVRGQLERLTGDLAVQLSVAGTTARPLLEGSVIVSAPVRLQPVALDREVVIPSGVIRLSGQTVDLQDLAVTVDDATLKLRGRARFDEAFAALAIELDVAGEVSAALLETVAPDAVSEAGGKARIQARVAGAPTAPAVTARVDLRSISLRLRDLGREVTFESGTVELTSKEIVLRDIRTRLDEGRLQIGASGRPGRIQFTSLYPELQIGNVDLPLKGDRLSYRAGDSVVLEDMAVTLTMTGDPDEGLRLAGEVLIMSGRYIEDFTVGNLMLSRRVSEGSRRSVYDTNPMLADLALDLRVRTVGDSFVVSNNLAPEIHVVVDLRISGSPIEPRIAGELRPTDGRFHILGMRGDFELVPNVNHVTFVETKSIDRGETPELNLEAQNLVTDSLGNEHNVRMRIRGPIGQAAIELSSDSGLDRNQTLLLLVSGRTTEDVTRFGTTANPTIGSNFRTATDVVGQLTRDTVANLVEPYIDDTLQRLTGRVFNLRPTVGADGFELRLSARVSRQWDLNLSYLRGLQNQQRYRGEAGVWLSDYLTLRGFGERLILAPQQGLTETSSSINLEMSFDFPLRLWFWH